MALTKVKAATGRLVRHPVTHAPLPNIEDKDADPALVDLDDPHWYRRLRDGDIVGVHDQPAAPVTASAEPDLLPEATSEPAVEPVAEETAHIGPVSFDTEHQE